MHKNTKTRLVLADTFGGPTGHPQLGCESSANKITTWCLGRRKKRRRGGMQFAYTPFSRQVFLVCWTEQVGCMD